MKTMATALTAAVVMWLALECQAAAPHRRGFAAATEGRPARFPHRIWAFSGFEARPGNFGWFGDEEKKNIPKYPGNRTARRGAGPWKTFAALKTGMNPVPGPRMGAVNKLYVRYYITGTDKALLQHYSLSSADNCNIRVSGLAQGRWSEMVLDFTRDSRRNNGAPGAFKKGERMDDLQVYVGKPGDGKQYEVIIDDPILFAEEPGAPPEPEPFPRRVMFLAAFDTGIDPKSRQRYFPGEFEPAIRGAKETFGIGTAAPEDSYWVVARAVPKKGTKDLHVLLEMKPPRPVGPNTKVRFRYWAQGAAKVNVILHDATAKRDRAVAVAGCKQGRWVTEYVTFSKDEQSLGGKFATGSLVDSISFVTPGAKDVELFVDEIVLFDAGAP